MKRICSTATLLFIAALGVMAQAKRDDICPTVVGLYPVNFNRDEPLRRRARFEIRDCEDRLGSIQLLGFPANATAPTLVEGGTHIVLLIHTGTILVVQTSAGSSSPTLVAQFQRGKPVLLGSEDGVGGITYAEEGGYAIIAIPQKTFPDADGRFPQVPPHRYRLKIY